MITGSLRSRSTAETRPGTGRLIPVPMYGLTQGELLGSATAGSYVDRMLNGEVGDTFRAGVVFHTGQMASAVGDRLRALPIAAIWS